jgi:hypothetical protein
MVVSGSVLMAGPLLTRASRAFCVSFRTGSKLKVALLGDGDAGSIGMFSIAGAGSSSRSVMSDVAELGGCSEFSKTTGETGSGIRVGPAEALALASTFTAGSCDFCDFLGAGISGSGICRIPIPRPNSRSPTSRSRDEFVESGGDGKEIISCAVGMVMGRGVGGFVTLMIGSGVDVMSCVLGAVA